MNDEYDSTNETTTHIKRVRALLRDVMTNLDGRCDAHDRSKLQEPEKSAFDYATGRLKKSTYGSDEYKGFLAELGPALDHHYAHNSHHPEHYAQFVVCPECKERTQIELAEARCGMCGLRLVREPNISGMSLLDLIEMVCDWKAAGERHENGSMEKSLQHNQTRFSIGGQLQSILENTAREMGWK